jgi:hypothetical protein
MISCPNKIQLTYPVCPSLISGFHLLQRLWASNGLFSLQVVKLQRKAQKAQKATISPLLIDLSKKYLTIIQRFEVQPIKEGTMGI